MSNLARMATDILGLQSPQDGVELLMKEGKFAAAVDLCQQMVHENKNRLGLEHPLTISSSIALGKALHGDGRIEKALRIFEELLPLSEEGLGLYHTHTLEILDAISEELCNMGRYELSLEQLINQRQRCELAFGLQHERTIRLLVDIAHMLKLLSRAYEASSAFSLALDRSQKGLGPRHELTMAIKNDLRGLQKPLSPTLEQMKAVLLQIGLQVPTEPPFPNSRSATWRETFYGFKLKVSTTVGYEAANAISLRMTDFDGAPYLGPPVSIPTYYANTSKVKLGPMPTQVHVDHSFQSLVSRSCAALHGRQSGHVPAIQEAVDKHVAFLNSLKSLDELLNAKENPVWFFQHRESFMKQTGFAKWDPNSLEKYIILPLEGGFANPEDCIFISHYWRTKKHPDPDGEDLRQLQKMLNNGYWSQATYVWIDWTCLPQWERTVPEQQYFSRILQSIPRLVRDCAFVAHFHEFKPRLWVLFEVAAFLFNRAEAVGLPSTDLFEKHLLQMKEATSVRFILDKYGYKCTNMGDREWVITSLEILLALRKTVPSIHTRRQILDAIDNSAVRSCIHREAGVEIDKERGILKAKGTTFQFSPITVADGFPDSSSDVCITGDYEVQLARALQRARESFDVAGVGEIAREYDHAGDYRIAEVLHRQAVATREDLVTSEDLTTNLESQGRYEDALSQCQRDLARPGVSVKSQQKAVALQQKAGLFNNYLKWKSEPMESSLPMGNLPGANNHTKDTLQPAIRNGLRRSWLQRLDQSVWQCEDPAVMKSMEEHILEFEEQGLFSTAAQNHWRLLARRKESLGPYHVDTRRSLSHVARALQRAGNPSDAHLVYVVALAVCDFTLGPRHPESRAVIGDLATAVLLKGRPGLARGYYRQQLERTLAVAGWDDLEALAPKFFLWALMKDEGLQIVQAGEATTVDITPGATRALQKSNESSSQQGKQSRPAQRITTIMNVDNADILTTRWIIA